MKYAIIILAALLAAGCASVESSNPRSVTIAAGTAMKAKAQQLADAECAKHGRYARYNGRLSLNEFVYDCVE